MSYGTYATSDAASGTRGTQTSTTAQVGLDLTHYLFDTGRDGDRSPELMLSTRRSAATGLYDRNRDSEEWVAILLERRFYSADCARITLDRSGQVLMRSLQPKGESLMDAAETAHDVMLALRKDGQVTLDREQLLELVRMASAGKEVRVFGRRFGENVFLSYPSVIALLEGAEPSIVDAG